MDFSIPFEREEKVKRIYPFVHWRINANMDKYIHTFLHHQYGKVYLFEIINIIYFLLKICLWKWNQGNGFGNTTKSQYLRCQTLKWMKIEKAEIFLFGTTTHSLSSLVLYFVYKNTQRMTIIYFYSLAQLFVVIK
jgi:hypothetical protein